MRLTGWDPEMLRWGVPYVWIRMVAHAAQLQDAERESRDVRRILG